MPLASSTSKYAKEAKNRNAQRKTSKPIGPSKSSKCTNCIQCLSVSIKSTPYKSTVTRIGTKAQKSWIFMVSIALALTLVTIGVVFSQLELIDFEAEMSGCSSPDESATFYIDKFRNMTNWDELHLVGNESVNLTQSLNQIASERYEYRYTAYYAIVEVEVNDSNAMREELDDQGIEYEICDDDETMLCYSYDELTGSDGEKWPSPHETDINELIASSIENCYEKMKVCIDSKLLGILCKTVEVPCTPTFDISNDDTVDLYFGGDTDYTEYSETDTATMDASDWESEVEMTLFEIAERANLIGSIYCFYTAAMVFCGPPFVITSHRWSTKIQFQIGTLSKPWFIVLVLLLWYFTEIAQYLYSQLWVQMNLVQILSFALKDPCFANGDFMESLYTETAQICADIQNSESLYDASRSNLDHYQSIEATYQGYYWDDETSSDIKYLEEDRLFTDTVLEDNGIYWNNATECSMENMLVDVGPSGSLEIWDVVLLWAAISAFLIQPVLANWIKCIFVLIHPLSTHSGRVVIPYKQEHEEPDSPVAAKSNLDRAIEELKKECEEKQLIEDIVRFERRKILCPLVFWTIILVVLSVSIAVAMSWV